MHRDLIVTVTSFVLSFHIYAGRFAAAAMMWGRHRDFAIAGFLGKSTIKPAHFCAFNPLMHKVTKMVT